LILYFTSPSPIILAVATIIFGTSMRNFLTYLPILITLNYPIHAAAYGVYRVNFELKPLNSLTSDQQGFTGLGGEIETMIWRRFGIVAGAARLNLTDSQKFVGDSSTQQGDIKPSEATIQKLRAGLRAYSSRGNSSFYLGAHLQRSEDQFKTNNFQQDLSLEGRRDEGLVELGYRWFWTRGMVFRFGAHLSQSKSTAYRASDNFSGIGLTQDIVDEIANQFSEQQRRNRSDIAISADVGIGVAF